MIVPARKTVTGVGPDLSAVSTSRREANRALAVLQASANPPR